MKIILIIWIALLIGISILCGSLYSIYNTDAHHWGFIVGTALDYIHGRKLFTEVYVQYGAGQFHLFKLLSSILPIHFTMLGIITSLVYSLHLLVIFLGLKKIGSPLLAVLMTTAAFFIHTYPIYPWPDYYAGFFLTVACYLMLGYSDHKRSVRVLLVGTMLFFSALFRNTYFFSIGLAGTAYVLVCYFQKDLRNKNIVTSLILFLVLSTFYVFTIYLQGNLHLFLGEGIGTAGSAHYHLGTTSILLLLQRAFLPINIFRTDSFSSLSLAVLLYLAFFTAWKIVFRKKDFEKLQNGYQSGVPLFLAFLGLAGIIQVLHRYEVFRVQNACGTLYFVGSMYLMARFPDLELRLKQKRMIVVLGIFFAIHLLRFPNGSAYFPIIDGDRRAYSVIQVPFFKWHRFRAEELQYYQGLVSLICSKRQKIVNLTKDSTIPYLCGDVIPEPLENHLNLPFFTPEMLMQISPAQFSKISAGEYEPDTLIVSEYPIARTQELGQVLRPTNIRFLGPAKIYILVAN